LLDEEIVNVEVWTHDEPRLDTIQEMQLNKDKKKSSKTALHLKDQKSNQTGPKEQPNTILTDEANDEDAAVASTEPYQPSPQRTGQLSKNDLAIVNVNNGLSKLAIKGNPSPASLSPNGEYAYGYNQVDSTWYTYNIKTSKYTELTKGKMFLQ
jgi:hypothetical protein